MAVRLGPIHEKRRTCLARMCGALENIERRVERELAPLAIGTEITNDRSFRPAVSPECDLPLRFQCLLQMLVISILQLGAYLSGWTEKWKESYPKSIPIITEVPLADEDQSGKLEEHIEKILGSLPKDVDFTKEIAEIEKMVQKLFEKGLPKWMEEFMEDLRDQFKNRRIQYVERLRDVSAQLRVSIGHPNMAEKTMEFILSQWRLSFEEKVKEKREGLEKEMAALKQEPKEIEKQLSSWLASVEDTLILDDLEGKETQRYEDALNVIQRYEAEFTALFWDESLGYRKTLQDTFSVFVKIIDSLPLQEQFDTSMAIVDEGAKRRSLKRRLRCATPKVHDELPSRVWEGMKADKIVEIMRVWGEREEIEPELPVESYRSPVHKTLFRYRNQVFEEGILTFDSNQKEIRALLDHFQAEEVLANGNFKVLAHQLRNMDEEKEES